jgi:hypothetical protein
LVSKVFSGIAAVAIMMAQKSDLRLLPGPSGRVE